MTFADYVKDLPASNEKENEIGYAQGKDKSGRSQNPNCKQKISKEQLKDFILRVAHANRHAADESKEYQPPLRLGTNEFVIKEKEL